MFRSSSHNSHSKSRRLPLVISALLANWAILICTVSNADSFTPSQRLLNCYTLGKESFEPVASTIRISEIVQAKKEKPKQLPIEINAARKAEQFSAQNTLLILTKMHAPQTYLTNWQQASQLLAAPLVISIKAKQDFPRNHDEQVGESYFDEADLAFPDDHGTISAWVKISQGTNGLWAYHLGQLESSLESIKLKLGKPALIDIAGPLAGIAPPKTSDDLIAALREVAKENDSGKLKQESLNLLHDNIADVFGG